MPEMTNVDVAELLAIIGEQQVIARKREQKISELEARIKAMMEAKDVPAPYDVPDLKHYQREKVNG